MSPVTSSMAAETDINTKYQKLATEYAKLRSQISVLKKGVLDEQDKSSVLSDQLNDRETQLRKQESEMEGILFRNQQLTRRVNVLQEEIDTLNSKPKSKWKIGGGDSTGGHQDKDIHASRVINEELAAKITENARLHATLDDIEKQYETTIQTLQTRIQQLEKEKNQLGLDRKNHESETNDSIQHYSKENDELRNQIIVLKRDLGVRTKQIESLEVQVSVLVERERNLESVKYCDFSSQYEYINPDQVREQEQKERDLVALNTRLSECVSQLSQAERDREHWKLEYQLATIKLNKNNTQTPDSEGDAEMNDSSLLDSSTVTANDHNQIKDAFENRISELISDKITADSKATAFFLECEAVNYKLEDLSSQLLEKENIYEDQAKVLQRKEEEWQTMQSNYEEQLSVISDHLAEMNTRLASQEDEIQLLRQTKTDTTDSKKNKGKKILGGFYFSITGEYVVLIGGGLNGTERNGVIENGGHGGHLNGSAGSNKTANGQVGTWHCSGCGEIMLPGAVAIFAERAGQDKCWHPSCFSCCSCGELLEDLLYFFSKGKLYCGRDFAAMMDIPRCAACDELIFATEYTGAEDQYWHLKHFCCFVCDSPLAGHKYIPVNGQPHCLNCWQNVHGKVCNTCQSYIHPEDQRVTLGDSHWHAKSECFKCGVCSKSLLGGKMTRREGTLLCSSACAAQLGQQKNQPAAVPQLSAAKQSRQPSGSSIMSAPNISSQQKQSTLPSLGSPRNSSNQLLGNKLGSSSSGSHLSYGGSTISNGGHYVPTGQILGNRPGPQVPSLATRVSSSNLSSGKPSSPRPLGSTMIGSAHRGSSSTLVSSNPSSPGPLTSPSYSHAYGGHLAGSPTPMNHRNSPVSPPPPPPKPGLQATGNLLPYQPLLHVQQQKPSVHQNGRHVQFASSTRPGADQSSDGYSSNHSTPPFHSRESSYSTIV